MRASVMIAEVYDNILGELEKRLIIFHDGKVYKGCLFFPLDGNDMIMKVISVNYVDGSVWDVMMEAYTSLKVNEMLAKDGKTLMTMLHWQYVNGFSDEMFTDVYGYSNDNEYIQKRKAIREFHVIIEADSKEKAIENFHRGEWKWEWE